MSHNGHNPTPLTKDYYWVCAVVNGRPFVQGWHSNESDAERWGFDHLTGKGINFEVLPFRTIDRFSARDKWRNILFERGYRLESIMARAKYKV